MTAATSRSQLAEQLVWKVRHDLKIPQQGVPPRRALGSIATGLKVTSSAGTLATNDGYLCRSDNGGFQVVINGELTMTRAAFTLAHELGHIIVDRYGVEDPDGNVELLCDAVASRILLPTEWLRAITPQRAVTLVDLLAISDAANVSPFAVVLRMNEEGQRICVFRLKKLRSSGRWLICTAIGMSHAVRRCFHLTPDADLFLAESDGRPVSDVVVEFASGDTRFVTSGEICVDGLGATLRVDLVLRKCGAESLSMKGTPSERRSVLLKRRDGIAISLHRTDGPPGG